MRLRIAFAISFYVVYFILCLLEIGILWIGFSLLLSAFVLLLSASWGGERRYSPFGDYYWTEPKVTADLAILLFLTTFLICTSISLMSHLVLTLGLRLGLFVAAIIFIMGLTSTIILAVDAEKWTEMGKLKRS